MEQIQPSTSRRNVARYGIPVGVAGVTAVVVGLIPALADSGAPDLPKISAEKLIAKMAASDTQHLTGTVKVSTDLGLPELPGTSAGGGSGKPGGGLFGGGEGKGNDKGKGKGDKGKVAAPREKLLELASGEHTLRVAADGPDKRRVSIVEDASEYSFIRNGHEIWAYDSGSDSAMHAKPPKGAAGKHGKHGMGPGGMHGKHGMGPGGGLDDVTPQQAAKQVLKASEKTTSVTVDGTARVAGRDAYQLLVKPKGATHSTVDSVRIAVDADNGTPLKFTLVPKGGGKPVVDVGFTKVDFGKPAAGTFDFKPPKGTDVTEAGPRGKGQREHLGMPGMRERHGMAEKFGKGEKFGKFEKHGKFGKFDKFEKGQKPRFEKGEGPGFPGLKTLGKGWGAVAEFDLGKGGANGLPGAPAPGGEDGKSSQSQKFLDSFTEKAKGDFGTGRIFHTRLVNALMTDDGKVYVGAVTKEGLIKAADAAAN